MLLAGDIGGTKTILALFEPGANPFEPLAQTTQPSREYNSLEALASVFLADQGVRPTAAVFGVAGAVVAGRAMVTNLPWSIEEQALSNALRIPQVQLINDLESIACSVPALRPQDLHTINVGKAEPGGAIGVIAPGTGLGEGFLTWDGARYVAHPSEGGHASFSPEGELQMSLCAYLMERLGHVSTERVCSGLGIPNIYAYLRDSELADEPAWFAHELAQAGDPTPLIVNSALGKTQSCDICEKTLQLFVSILGSEAGDLALMVLATGGIYLGGGIPPRIVSILDDPDFMQTFCSKGRLSDLMAKIPVHVILNPQAGLIGAARHALELHPAP